MAVIGKIRSMTGLLVFTIALAIICFLLMDATGAGASGTPNSIGEVNGMNLDGREYQRRIEQTLNNSQRNGQALDEAARINARNSAYRSYVKDVLAEAEYEKLGVMMTKDEMEDLIYGVDPHPSVKNEATFQEGGVFKAEKVTEYLDGLRASGDIDRARGWNNFKNFLRRDGKRKKYSALINQAMYTPTFLAESKNIESNGTASIEYVKVPYTEVEDSEISVSDNDLRAYLNANKGQYEQEETRAVDYVIFDLDASDADIASTKQAIDEMIEELRNTSNEDIGSFINLESETKYFDTYVSAADLKGNSKSSEILAATAGTIIPTFMENNSYKAIKVIDSRMAPDTVECAHILIKVAEGADDTAAKTKIDSIKTAILAGLDFDAAASQFSEDAANKDQGGDLGKVTKGRMVKPFNDLIFFQAKQGDLETVKTNFGWHLVKINKSVPTTKMVKFAEASRAIVPSSETTSAIYDRASEFAGRNNSEQKLRAAAEAMELNMESSGDFEATSTAIGTIGASENLINWAFTHEVGDVSDVIELGDKYAVAVLTSAKEAGLPDINDMRDELESLVKNEKKAEKLIAQISGTDLNAIASQFNTTVGTADGLKYNFISTGDLGKEPKVIASAFALKEGEVSKPFAGDQGVFVVKSTGIDVADIADMTSFKNTERTKNKTAVDFYSQEALFKSADISDLRMRNIALSQQMQQ